MATTWHSVPPADRSCPRPKGRIWLRFEADYYDEQTRSGWSDVVTGRAEVVDAEADVQRLTRRGLHPWVTAVQHPFWIQIRPTSVSGRQTPGTM